MLFVLYYIKWHYTQALFDLVNILKNFVWFFFEFFSIRLFFKTLFSPFHRLGETYRGGIDIENYFETIIVNTLMRFVGFFLRLTLIIIGFTAIIFTILFGIFFLFVWLLSPLLLTFLILYGIKMVSIP